MKTRKRLELARSAVINELPLACSNEQAAVEFLEAKRWGDCPGCPECGSIAVYKMTDRQTRERNHRFLWRCRDCDKMYTVRTGTVYAESLIPLHKWLRALWETGTAKNGVSALEMSRRLQISYKSSLFLMHRIRHAMSPTGPQPKLSGVVEIDETYVGGRPRYRPPQKGPNKGNGKNPRGRGARNKSPVVAVVQRGGDFRASVVGGVTAENLGRVLRDNVESGSRIMTDDFTSYRRICPQPGTHRVVRHTYGEYSKPDPIPGNPIIHTNTIEGFFSRLKRGLNGTYHAVSRTHLHLYVSQYQFLYNTRRLNDGERVLTLIRETEGKRLMYRKSVNQQSKIV